MPSAIVVVPGLDASAPAVSAFCDALARQLPNRQVNTFEYPRRLRDFHDLPDGLHKHRVRLSQYLADKPAAILVGHCLGALMSVQHMIATEPEQQTRAILLDPLTSHPDGLPGPWLAGLLDLIGLTARQLRQIGMDWRKGLPARQHLIEVIQGEGAPWLDRLGRSAGLPAEQLQRIAVDHNRLMGDNPDVAHAIARAIARLDKARLDKARIASELQ